jgi:hypothetical protein
VNELQLTAEMSWKITVTTAKHMRRLNEELSDLYPNVPDLSFMAALGTAISSTIVSFTDSKVESAMVQRLNDTLADHKLKWRLTAVP